MKTRRPIPLTPEQARAKLMRLAKIDDTEHAHVEADKVMLALLLHYGCPAEVIEAYDAIHKWFS